MRGSSWRRRRGRRGVSEVVATVLLLALTIVLFASVFFFTSRLGNPASGTSSSFTASLSYLSPTSTTVTNVSITRLSGPALPGSTTAIYLRSQSQPNALPASFSLASGLNGSTTWSFGQTWTVNIVSYGITAPDNLTISVVSHAQLLYSSLLSASRVGAPPTILSVHLATTPAAPVHGAAFTVNLSAYVIFSVPTGATVTLNLSQFGGSAATAMSGSGTGTWTYVGSVTAPSAGTYDLILTATGGSGLISNFQLLVAVS